MTRLGAGLQPRYVWLGFYSTSQGFDMALLAIIHAAIAGFMLFFTAVVPQAAFKTLSAKAVGAFLRVLFPRSCLAGGGGGFRGECLCPDAADQFLS